MNHTQKKASITISPPCRFEGEISLPPSKSITHRVQICSFFAQLQGGAVPIFELSTSLLQSEDTIATDNALIKLSKALKTNEKCDVFCNESATTLRFFLPIFAAFGLNVIFYGKNKLSIRDISPYKELFSSHGATISFHDEDCKKYLPAKVCGKLLSGKYYIVGDISSQFISGLLLALSTMSGDSEIILKTSLVSSPYVDLTIEIMRRFSVKIEKTNSGYLIKGGQKYSCKSITIPSDASALAPYLCAIEAVKIVCPSKLGKITFLNSIEDEGLYQADSIITSLLPNPPGIIDITDTPDLAPALSLLFSVSHGTFYIKGIERLRDKESDRAASICEMLNCLGANARITNNSLVIVGSCAKPLKGGAVKTYCDHRIAIVATFAALVCREAVIVDDILCTGKSYPDFINHFYTLTGKK